MNIQKIFFASTSNSGSLFLDLVSHFLLFLNSEFRTLGRNLERSAGISNVWPEPRTFCQNLERSAGISNVLPESRTFGRNLQRSDEISNVRPESRTFGRNLERPARISNVRPKFRTLETRFWIVHGIYFFLNYRWLMFNSFKSIQYIQYECEPKYDYEFMARI